MNVFETDKVRTIVFAGHNGSGKTTLVSSFLYTSGKSSRLLTPDEGHAPTDFDEEEIERKISIQNAVAFCEWKDHKINIIDTPGYAIFFPETASAIKVADCVGIVVNGVNGPQVQTQKIYRLARKINQPIFFIVNKMDKEHADPDGVLSSMQERYGNGVIPLTLPMGKEEEFRGVVDVISGKAYECRGGIPEVKEIEIPGEFAEAQSKARENLVEKVAEGNEDLMNLYFEEGDLPAEDLMRGLHEGILSGDIMPVFFTSSQTLGGVAQLMDAIVAMGPTADERPWKGKNPVSGEEIDPPDSTSCFVFKTISDPFAGRITLFRVVSGLLKADSQIYNASRNTTERIGTINLIDGKTPTSVNEVHTGDIASVMKLKETLTGDTLCEKGSPIIYEPHAFPEPAISFAIEPKSKGDEDKIGAALQKINEEDSLLKVGRDPQTKEQILSGTGQLHIEIVVSKLKRRYSVDVDLKPPKVPYRETVVRKAEATYRHKKQTGGRGQFAECSIIMEPLPAGGGYEFVDKIFGGSISQNYRPAVDKGVREASEKGFLAGYPVVDFRVTLVDGKEHPVDSSEMAFKIAGSQAFKAACEKAGATILEPIMSMDVYTPDEYMGDVMGDLSGRRGRVSGMDVEGDMRVIHAQVPLAEVLSYASDLRSFTQGQGSFHMEFSNYDEVPKMIQEKIIAASKKEEE